MKRSPYETKIRQTLARIGRIGADPIHVECWMRVEHGTLDALSPAAFEREVEIGADWAEADPGSTRLLARSYGFAD